MRAPSVAVARGPDAGKITARRTTEGGGDAPPAHKHNDDVASTSSDTHASSGVHAGSGHLRAGGMARDAEERNVDGQGAKAEEREKGEKGEKGERGERGEREEGRSGEEEEEVGEEKEKGENGKGKGGGAGQRKRANFCTTLSLAERLSSGPLFVGHRPSN